MAKRRQIYHTWMLWDLELGGHIILYQKMSEPEPTRIFKMDGVATNFFLNSPRMDFPPFQSSCWDSGQD